MSDRDDSNDFEDLDENRHILRRTFVWRFQRPEDAATFNRLGEILQEWIYETNQFGPDEDVPLISAELQAAGEDLMLLAEYLRAKAYERFDSGLAEDEARLCERAELWAQQAKALAETILADLKAA